MYDVDTLFVISSARGEYVLNDLISSIQWSCPGGSTFTVAVDETNTIKTLSAEGAHEVIHTSVDKDACSGFHRMHGLKWAIDKGISYKQVIFLDDSCLVMGQPFDAYLLDQTSKEGVGLLGVQDTTSGHAKAFHAATNLFYEWEIPHQNVETPPPALADAFMALSPQFVGVLYQRKLLTPTRCNEWPGGFGEYLSWLCTMLGFYMVSWGATDKTLPPFYINTGVPLPSPTILAQRFLVFSSVREVLGNSESDIRELFKRQRGEPARTVTPFSPTVTGPAVSG